MKPAFSDRIRFNWGFWDGRLRAELKLPYRYSHFDKVYLAGEHAGMEHYKAGNPEPRTSNEAWKTFKEQL